MAKMWNKWGRRGTEGRADILDKFVGGSGGGGGKIGFKYKPSGKGATNISGPTQTSGMHPSVAKQGKTINPVSFWLSKGVNKITSFGVISAGSAAATKKKKQKKRVGRTILTEY